MQRRFCGQHAVVTGGGSGIGAATAQRLAAEGAHVLVVDIDGDQADRVAAACGGEALRMDVADPRAWTAVQEFEPGLAHFNAGVGTPGVDLGAFEDAVYEHIRAINLDAMVWGLRAVVPSMRRSGGGAIVMTASSAGLDPYGGDPFYTATKHAVVGLARAAALRLARDRITVDAMCPGLTNTPMAAPMIEKRRREQPDLQVQSADDVAALVADVLADDSTGRALVCRAGKPLYLAPAPSLH